MKFSEIELPSNRKFGGFCAVLLSIFAGFFLTTGSTELACLFGSLFSVILATTLTKPDLLSPLNSLWMRLGRLLGLIVSPIVLGIIFFGLFTPIALVMRISGRDELRVRIKDRKSYWISRDEPSQPDSFDRQF